MPRQVKYYQPEDRRYNIENNLQCIYCGNTTSFYMDLRLRHQIEVDDNGYLSVELNKRITERVFKSVANNIWDILDKSLSDSKGIIHCANCNESDAVDFQGRLLEYCWQMGCPGCDVCGEFISEEEVRKMCTDCIKEHNGVITEEDCQYACPQYDDGLTNVLNHYNLDLEQLKRELGY